MPSRTTRKSTRPGASDRSMVDTVQPPGLASFRDRSASPRLEDRATKMGNRLNVSHGAPQNQASFIVDRAGSQEKFLSSGRGRNIFLDIPFFRPSDFTQNRVVGEMTIFPNYAQPPPYRPSGACRS